MKIYQRFLFLLVTGTLALVSCKNNTNNEVKPKSHTLPLNVFTCHHHSVWDSTRIMDTIVGQWEWQYITASPFDWVDSTSSKGLCIDIQKNGKINVTKNGTSIQTSTWQLKKNYSTYYTLETQPKIFEVDGIILFCENYVIFNTSHRDAYDEYFRRK